MQKQNEMLPIDAIIVEHFVNVFERNDVYVSPWRIVYVRKWRWSLNQSVG